MRHNIVMQEQRDTAALDDALWKFLVSLAKDRFYGVAELHFQDGQVVRVKKQEVFLPKDFNRLTAE